MKLLVLLIGILELCSAAKILFLIPMPSKSHYILGERLIEELIKKGHEITIIAPFKRQTPLKNLTEIVTTNCIELFAKQFVNSNEEGGKFNMRNMSPFSFLFFSSIGELLFEETMNHAPVQDLVKSNQKFDLVIGECFLAEGLMGGFAHKFNASIVGFSTFIPNTWANEMVGNPAPSSYVPEPILHYTENMSFIQRTINFVYSTTAQLAHYFRQIPSQNRLMKKHFGENTPELKDMLKKTSLVLVNHHYSLAFPRPYLPNMVEIGGFHVKPIKPLPKDLQKFVDEAKDGVIFFSMGSNLQSSDFPKQKFEGLLKIFSRLKQRVLWKFEMDNIQNLPPNVKVSKWMPQSDILAHPNVKLFITHGGLLSLIEAVLRGVPVLGVPIFGDQPMNMNQVEKLEIGRAMNYDDIGEEVMYKLIQEILNNPKYSKNIKYRSVLLQDVPVPHIDLAVYWIEYVIRHRGASHLISGAQDLAWYQLYLLDVLFVILLLLAAFQSISFTIIKFLYRSVCGRKRERVDPKKKKN